MFQAIRHAVRPRTRRQVRPRAAWLAVLASLCLLLATLHFGAMAGQRPHGFGHWENQAVSAGSLDQAPEDGAPEAGRHDDQPAKKRRVNLQPVARDAEPMPAAPTIATPLALLAVPAFSEPEQSSANRASLRSSDRVPVRPAPPCQRHRGQAPPARIPPTQTA